MREELFERVVKKKTRFLLSSRKFELVSAAVVQVVASGVKWISRAVQLRLGGGSKSSSK